MRTILYGLQSIDLKKLRTILGLYCRALTLITEVLLKTFAKFHLTILKIGHGLCKATVYLLELFIYHLRAKRISFLPHQY